ncbi:MAG: hypothetical protein AB8G23_05970 [Myxococcota bacterium]
MISLSLLNFAAGAALAAEVGTAGSEEALVPFPIEWEMFTGFDYSVGDYGLSRETEVLYFPVALQVTVERFRARLTLPLLLLEGPTGFLPDTGGAGAFDALDVESEFGLGQLMLSGSYLFGNADSLFPFLEATVRLVAPTESKNELGPGLWSGALQLDAFDTFGRMTPFVRLGRRFYEGAELDDRFYASVGASVKVFRRASVGLAYDWLEATSGAVDDAHQLTPFLSLRWADRFRVGPYAILGLSEGAPEWGIGCSFGVRL